MNSKTKKRLLVVTGIIVIVAVIILAVVGGNGAAKTVSVAEAASGNVAGQRIQVSGNVVENSYTTEGDVLTFSIYDAADPSTQVRVRYDGGVSATFGNEVTAICTGTMGDDGLLACSELVTKCPSKYESGTDALSVERLLGYGDSIIDKPVKVTGQVVAGSQNAAGTGHRFTVSDAEGGATLPVDFDDALSEQTTADGATVVITGSLNAAGSFAATDVSLKG